MTRVYAERDDQRCVLSAQGHATGSVEACAAVSDILYALAGYVANTMRERYVKAYTWWMENGDIQLDFNGDDGTATAFEMTVIGLAQVIQAHPEQVQVECREEKQKFFLSSGREAEKHLIHLYCPPTSHHAGRRSRWGPGRCPGEVRDRCTGAVHPRRKRR